MADSSPHERAEKTLRTDVDFDAASDAWSEFAPSFPALINKSQQLVTAASQLGQCIGDFEILSLLGEGAFGKVFLARQLSLDRNVALKITANLGHEGRTMARLEHSHVVQVFSETIDHDLELRLLCMQYVPGATLGQIIQRLQQREREQWSGEAILSIVDDLSSSPTTLDPASLRGRVRLSRFTIDEAVCQIGQQLAEALAYAHGRNVLHRDIKPANVIVNQYGRPMLTDFSLSFPTTGMANLGAAVFGGTLGYMAPEHLAALNPIHPCGPESVRERADIYSLGAVLLDLLTGTPRVTTDVQRSSGADLERMVDSDRVENEVVGLLRTAKIRAPLARVVRRCLQPDPDRRYANAQQLASALAGCLELLSSERKLPAHGAITRFAVTYPLAFILIFTVLPNILASASNIIYNWLFVVADLAPAQQSAFAVMVIGYNAVIVLVMAVLVERTLFTAVRRWRALARDPTQIDFDFRDTRQRTLRLPMWTVVLGSVGWLPFSVTIPFGMQILAGPIDRGAMLHISIAFFVTGLIAIAYNYYVVAFVSQRSMYTKLWGDDVERFGRQSALELSGIPRINRVFQVLAGLTPLGAATLLLLVGPDQFTASEYDRFRVVVVVLIGLGIVGFWIAMTATATINQAVGLLSSTHSPTDGDGSP